MSVTSSNCGRFRYRLERAVNDEGVIIAYFGVNPSTADASLDDATVRKWKGFSKLLGARKFIVGNIFAYRATNVADLAGAPIERAVWKRNMENIQQIIADADLLVPCWGNRAKAPKPMRADFDTVLAMLLNSGKPVMHFGLTKSGDPRHPLMLGYDATLRLWGSR